MGGNVINLDKYKSIGTHWIALFVNGDNVEASYNALYLDSFGVEHIPNLNSKQVFISWR